jgi:putative membrane protein insertion efficiency factor
LPVRLYQITLSPLLGSSCRFQPSCSNYMIQAIREWGPIKGGWLGIKRIGKCHPWGPQWARSGAEEGARGEEVAEVVNKIFKLLLLCINDRVGTGVLRPFGEWYERPD